MIEIKLTGEKAGNSVAIIDDDDYDLVKNYSWNLNSWGYAYSGSYNGNVKKSFLMHRIILEGLVPDGMQVDHINGNKLDNRKCNLRIVTQSENQRNRGATVVSKSGYKGVTFDKDSGKWNAIIGIENKHHFLGSFDAKEDAAHEYNLAAEKLHGEFAYLNELPGDYFPNYSRRKYTSMYRGVCYVKKKGKWRARIIVNGEEILLGFFVDEGCAALAYNAAAIKYYGKRAILNIIGVDKNAPKFC